MRRELGGEERQYDNAWAGLLALRAGQQLRQGERNTERVHEVLTRLAVDLHEIKEFERFSAHVPFNRDVVFLDTCVARLFNSPGDDSSARCFRVIHPRQVVIGDSVSRVALWERHGGRDDWQATVIAEAQASCLEIAPGGQVFIGTEGGELVVLHREHGRTFSEERRIELGCERVLWVRPEPQGGALVFTERGLFACGVSGTRAEHVVGALQGRKYSAIAYDSRGFLLIGTEGGELFRVHRESCEMRFIGGFSFPVRAIAPLGTKWIAVGGDDRVVVTKGAGESDDIRWGTHLAGDLVSLQALGPERFCSFSNGLLELWEQGTGDGWFGKFASFYSHQGKFGQQLLCTQAQLLPDGRLFMAGSAHYGDRIAAAQIISGGTNVMEDV